MRRRPNCGLVARGWLSMPGHEGAVQGGSRHCAVPCDHLFSQTLPEHFASVGAWSRQALSFTTFMRQPAPTVQAA